MPSFHTFAVFSRTKPPLQVTVRGNRSVIRKWAIQFGLIYLDVQIYHVLIKKMRLLHQVFDPDLGTVYVTRG